MSFADGTGTVKLDWPRSRRSYLACKGFRERWQMFVLCGLAVVCLAIAWFEPGAPWSALVFTSGFVGLVAAVAMWKAEASGSVGYYWLLPVCPVFVAASYRVSDGSHPWILGLTVVACGLATGVHVRFRHLTPAWAIGLACGISFATLVVLTYDFHVPTYRNLLVFAAPLVLLPVIVANTTRRSAVIVIIVLPLLSAGWLVRVAVRSETLVTSSCPGGGGDNCVEQSYIDLARIGWNLLLTDLTDTDSYRITPPSGDWTWVILAAGIYLYACYLMLRFNTERLRNVVEVVPSAGEPSDGGPDAQVTPSGLPRELIETVVGGPVVLGKPAGESETTVVEAVASGLKPSAVATAIARTFRAQPPVRVSYEELGTTGHLRIENGISKRTVFATSYEADAGFSTQQQAGYSVLAYCLAARGSPSWATWRIDGRGLCTWADVRSRRRARWQARDTTSSTANPEWHQ